MYSNCSWWAIFWCGTFREVKMNQIIVEEWLIFCASNNISGNCIWNVRRFFHNIFYITSDLEAAFILGHQEVIWGHIFWAIRFEQLDFADLSLYLFQFLQRLIQHTMQIHPLMSKQDQQQFQVGLYHTFYPCSRLPDRQNLLNYRPRQKHFLH